MPRPPTLLPHSHPPRAQAFTAIILIINIRLYMNVTRHTWFFDLVVFLSMAVWFPALILFANVSALADNSEGMITYLFGSGAFWLWLLLVVIVTQLHVMSISFARRMFAPEYRDMVQEYNILMNKVGHKPSLRQRCLTCGMRRDVVRRARTPQEKLAILDRVYPQQSIEDPEAEVGRMLGSPSGSASPSSPQVVAAKGVTAAALGGAQAAAPAAGPATGAPRPAAAGAAGVPGHLGGTISPNAAQPLLGAAGSGPASPLTGGLSPQVVVKSVTADDLEVDFGPDLATLDKLHNPTFSYRRRPDALRLPLKEDEAEELVEWPVEQQMRVSLTMRRRQLYEEAREKARHGVVEDPEITLRKVKIDMLRARLSSLIEHGLSSAAEDSAAGGAGAAALPAASGAAGGEAMPPAGPLPPPPGAPSDAAVVTIKGQGGTGAEAGAGASFPAASPPAPAAVPVAGAGVAVSSAAPSPATVQAWPGSATGVGTAASAGTSPAVGPAAPSATAGSAGPAPSSTSASITPVSLTDTGMRPLPLPGQPAGPHTPSWALLQDIARVQAGLGRHGKRLSVTDFSVDDRSSAQYGSTFSTVGRRVAQVLPPRGARGSSAGLHGRAATESDAATAAAGRASLAADGDVAGAGAGAGASASARAQSAGVELSDSARRRRSGGTFGASAIAGAGAGAGAHGYSATALPYVSGGDGTGAPLTTVPEEAPSDSAPSAGSGFAHPSGVVLADRRRGSSGGFGAGAAASSSSESARRGSTGGAGSGVGGGAEGAVL
jgi:hypothetical protein